MVWLDDCEWVDCYFVLCVLGVVCLLWIDYLFSDVFGLWVGSVFDGVYVWCDVVGWVCVCGLLLL